MALLPILAYPDPRLRRRSLRVDTFDASLDTLIADLCETLRASRGIGLAAPQTGDLRQVLVVDLSDGSAPPEVYVNPEILSRSTPGLVEESCLSVPGVIGNVVRATQLRVRAQSSRGEVFERELDGMHAVCLQHEMDHLAGRLFVDHLSPLRRILIRLRARAANRH